MRQDDTSPATAATKKIGVESTPIKAFWSLGDSSEQADRGIAAGFGKHPFGHGRVPSALTPRSPADVEVSRKVKSFSLRLCDDPGVNVYAFLTPQLRQIARDFEGDFKFEGESLFADPPSKLAFPHDVPTKMKMDQDDQDLQGKIDKKRIKGGALNKNLQTACRAFDDKSSTPILGLNQDTFRLGFLCDVDAEQDSFPLSTLDALSNLQRDTGKDHGDNNASLEMQQDPSIEEGSTSFFQSSEVQEVKYPDDHPLPDFLDIGSAVEVMWDGEWWEVVIKYHGQGCYKGRVCISYIGGIEEEDEWIKVDSARIRPPSIPSQEASNGSDDKTMDSVTAAGAVGTEIKKNGHQHSRAKAWAPWRRLLPSPKLGGHEGRLPSPKRLDFLSSKTSKQVKVEVSSTGLKGFVGVSTLKPLRMRMLKKKAQEPSGGLLMLAQAAHDLVLAGNKAENLDDQDLVEKVKQRKRQAPDFYDDATLTFKKPKQQKKVRAKPQESRTKAKPRLIAMTKGKEDRSDRIRRFECVIKDLEHNGALKVKRVKPRVLEDRKMALAIEGLEFVDRRDCYESLNLNLTQDMSKSHDKLCAGVRETMRYLGLMPVDSRSDDGKYHWGSCKFKFNEQVRTERLERAARQSTMGAD